MNLDLDPPTLALQPEVRSRPAAHVPPGRRTLPSMDTTEGYEAHPAREKQLFDAHLPVVSWPSQFGERDASLPQRVIFEEEHYAASTPARVSFLAERILGLTH